MIITLTTDFGTVDGYVGELKGVLLGRCPGATLADVTHSVDPGDIETVAWVLARIWDRFPERTVHLVVVDPGVGSNRRPLAARAAERWYVGPDNGALTLVAHRHPVEAACRLDPGRVGLVPLSDTFHGRDLFAPAAAHLAGGGDSAEVGTAMDPSDLVSFPVREAGRERDARNQEIGRGQVVHVDRFGNLITNLPSEWLSGRSSLEIAGREVSAVGRSFADVERGELVLIRGSGGTVEVAAREGSAAVRLGVGRGEPVRLRLPELRHQLDLDRPERGFQIEVET